MTTSNFIPEQIHNERVAELKAEIAALGMDNVRFGRRIASQSAEIDVRKAEIKRLEAELATARAEFSKECERFHAEGHKCVTCGRKDATEREAETAALLEKVAGHVPMAHNPFACICGHEWKNTDLLGPATSWQEHILALIPHHHAAALVALRQESFEAGRQLGHSEARCSLFSLEECEEREREARLEALAAIQHEFYAFNESGDTWGWHCKDYMAAVERVLRKE